MIDSNDLAQSRPFTCRKRRDAMSRGEDISRRDDAAAATELRVRPADVIRDQGHPRELDDAGVLAVGYLRVRVVAADLVVQQS